MRALLVAAIIGLLNRRSETQECRILVAMSPRYGRLGCILVMRSVHPTDTN
jgi:hypothetical protein